MKYKLTTRNDFIEKFGESKGNKLFQKKHTSGKTIIYKTVMCLLSSKDERIALIGLETLAKMLELNFKQPPCQYVGTGLDEAIEDLIESGIDFALSRIYTCTADERIGNLIKNWHKVEKVTDYEEEETI